MTEKERKALLINFLQRPEHIYQTIRSYQTDSLSIFMRIHAEGVLDGQAVWRANKEVIQEIRNAVTQIKTFIDTEHGKFLERLEALEHEITKP